MGENICIKYKHHFDLGNEFIFWLCLFSRRREREKVGRRKKKQDLCVTHHIGLYSIAGPGISIETPGSSYPNRMLRCARSLFKFQQKCATDHFFCWVFIFMFFSFLSFSYLCGDREKKGGNLNFSPIEQRAR